MIGVFGDGKDSNLTFNKFEPVYFCHYNYSIKNGTKRYRKHLLYEIKAIFKLCYTQNNEQSVPFLFDVKAVNRSYTAESWNLQLFGTLNKLCLTRLQKTVMLIGVASTGCHLRHMKRTKETRSELLSSYSGLVGRFQEIEVNCCMMTSWACDRQ